METINLRIKEICEQKNFTLTDLAQKSGISRESLSGQVFKNPTLKTLTKIANVLGVSISELFEKNDQVANIEPFGSIRIGEQVYVINSVDDIENLILKIREDLNKM